MVGLERLLIGRTLAGRYSVEELIGRGRGGLVYRARDAQGGAEVALKVLAAPQTAEARERYRRLVAGEVAVAAGIDHPNVVAVHALGVDPELDLDFVTGELARGQTLASVLAQRGKPPISLGLRLLSDAAEGLAAGHAAGLLHRDVRPASLYMVRSEAERQVRVKVGGFGVPQLVRRETLAAAPPEVSAYASPEMLANGSARLTAASDVFGLGVVGFQLMTGALPLDDDARRALAAGRTAEVEVPADLSSAVPPHVFEAVLQALRMVPAERFADAAAFAEALRQPASRPAVAVPAAFAAPEAAPAPRAEAAPAEARAAREDVAPPAEALPIAASAPVPAPAAATDTASVDAAPAGLPVAPPAATPAEDFVALAGGALSIDDAPAADATASAESGVDAPAAAMPESAAAPAEPSAAPATPAIPPSAPAQTRKGPMPRSVAADLELYYPPQASAAPATVSHPGEAPAAPVSARTTLPTPAPAAVEPTPVAQETPAAAVAETVAAPAAASVAPRPVSIGGKRKARAGAGAGGFRGSPAMAAGFVLGMLVLGSVGWMATRRSTPADATTGKVATNQLASGAPVAAAPATATPGAEPQAAATADTAAGSPEARRRALEEARKKLQDETRRKQQEDAARLALLQQQQATVAAATSTAQQPPAARPQAVAPPPVQQPVAVAQRPAPPPPPPPPPPAAAEEPAPTRAASNEVYDVADVEERPRLTNGAEIQRALQGRYPEALASSRVSGSVTATFVVNPDGRVDPSSIRIANSPNVAFNVPTQSVLRRARFRPATVRGQPVRVQVSMPVQWTAP
jgi:TonB family protein